MTNESYLAHYGVKGMQWGVRRFETKSGRLTKKGKERYDDGPVKSKKEIKIPDKKSKHRIKLEEKYKEEGLSNNDAEQKAAKRIRTEKIIAASAAVAVVGTAGYIAYKTKGKEIFDTKLNKNIKLHTISNFDDRIDSGNPFYASYKSKDKTIYKGYFSRRTIKSNPVYDIETALKNNVKIPSKKKAIDVFEEAFRNDPEFKNSVLNGREWFQQQNWSIERASPKDQKRMIRDLYSEFNARLVGHKGEPPEMASRYYSKLRDLGYSGLFDLNDMRGGAGLGTNSPVIIFDSRPIGKTVVNELSEAARTANSNAYNSIMDSRRNTANQIRRAREFAETLSENTLGRLGIHTNNNVWRPV